MGFTITYTSVVWTAGDIITEAKMDNMVANDQAYDAHASQGVELDEMSAPSTPASGKVRLYAKSDGNLYQKDDAGTETVLAGGGSSGLMSTTQYAPDSFLINGQIVPSVATSDLTVAIKGMDGNDPSVSNPVYVRIGNTVRTITSALSVTKNDATNWFNAGSAELATREIDYFVYLGYNATDGVVVGFARIPYARIYSDFSATSTNERYCAISTIANASAGDNYVNIGRFSAILSAGAGYTWTVPTFTSKNLIQYPIYHTRPLFYLPTHTGFSAVPTNICMYKIIDTILMLFVDESTQGTSNATTKTMTLPLSRGGSLDFSMVMALVLDNTSWQTLPGHMRLLIGSPTIINIGKTVHMGAWTASGTAGYAFAISYPLA